MEWELTDVAAAFVRDVAQKEGLTRRHAQEVLHDHGEYQVLLQEFRSAQRLVDAIRLAQFVLPPLSEVRALRSALGFDLTGKAVVEQAHEVTLSARRETYLLYLRDHNERSSFRTLVRQEAAAASLLAQTLPKTKLVAPAGELIQSLRLGKPT